MTIRPVDYTDSITFIWTPHTKSCTKLTQDECVCLLVSGSLTCPSCREYQASSPRCKACRIISSGRKAYVAAARREIQKRSITHSASANTTNESLTYETNN